MAIRPTDQFEARLEQFIYDLCEEIRSTQVGEKETSELSSVFERYVDLYSREQAEALRHEEERTTDAEQRERLYRLRRVCEDSVVEAEVVGQMDALQNAELATTVAFKGETMPLRAAQATITTLHDYKDRDELGVRAGDASATLNNKRAELLRVKERLEADISRQADPVARNEEAKGISLLAFADVVGQASDAIEPSLARMRERWFDRLLGSGRDARPRSFHMGYMRRLSPLEAVYTKERATGVCLESLKCIGFDLAAIPNIRLDVEDRPKKTPRAFCMPSNPPTVVHLVTRALGGLSDYEAFLHEAGHALHYAGCNPALPYTFRNLDRDHALTEIYSFIAEAIGREPGWHVKHFGLSQTQAQENAEAAMFIYALLFRRYVAKLRFELEFWTRFSKDGGTSEGYAETLDAATGLRYRPDGFLADMDAGFYSADYLRAWLRSAQLRAHLVSVVGNDWWKRPETGKVLKPLFWEGTKPSSEKIAQRLGFDPLDTRPLVDELTSFDS